MTETIRLREMTIRYSAGRDNQGKPLMIGRTIGGSTDFAPAVMALLQPEASEIFVVFCLSTKNRVTCYHMVSRGTLDSTPAHPREVFKAALLANASAIIVAHNHPSGDPTPSPDDHQHTARLAQAGQVLGVPLLDHLVTGDDRWISFRDLGLLPLAPG